ncbi:MAG: DegT/DnrJ/EryC1/StrS family aminotransferase [Bacteroidetes bacterium]|nr:MAG: DegT/DnrJ/EryC1/StrS family aminotransferase [Bacteroidota bacterium]
MDTIQMVDLKKQYQHIKSEVDKAVMDVIESAAFINGKPVAEFCSQLATFLGAKHVIPCANGTDALQIAMMALGLQPGDEVITPSFTYIATVEVVALLRLQPVFVDVNPHTFCMDADKLEAAITPRTRAIVPVHLYGHTAPMHQIMEIAARHNLFVIEDNAQAIGADYGFPDGRVAKTGTIGHIGCTSFFPSKNLGCYGDGGAICTNNDALADTMRKVANHGQSVRYYHDLVGCNSRLDTIQAAVLKIKLEHLNRYIDARRSAADYYDAAFSRNPKIAIPYRANYCRHVFHQYTLTLKDVNRDALVEFLAEKGIPSMIYYPVPAHRQKMFESFGSESTYLPTTDWLTERVISLPMHTELSVEQQDYIISNVLAYVNA